ILIIAVNATVYRIDDKKRGLFSSWSGGLKAATLLVPAGEHNVLFEYSHPDGRAAKKLKYTFAMTTEKMYMLSVMLDEKAKSSAFFTAVNVATSFVRDQIIDNIPFVGLLPSPNPEGLVYQISEIDQAAFDQYLLKNDTKVATSIRLLGIFVGLLWFSIIFFALRALCYFLFMGKFQSRHPFTAFILVIFLVVAGIVIMNYNSSGSIYLYLLSTLCIGIGISGWDFGGDSNKSGVEKMKANDYNEAISAFNEAIKVAPYNANYINNRGLAYYNLQDWRNAITDFTRAIKLKPNNSVYINNRGLAYYNLQDWEKAVTDFTGAIKLKLNAVYFYNRGNTYSYLQDWKKAVTDFSDAIKLEPNNANYINARGIAYNCLQDLEKAIGDFNNAVQLDPDNDTFKNNLADAQSQASKGRIISSAALNNVKIAGVMHNQAEFDKFIIEYPQKLASEGYQEFDRLCNKAEELYLEFSKLPVTINMGEIYEYTHDPYKLLISRSGLGVMISYIKI
ncbi:MAG: tetratricopeptide repeat protein, partial [Treponema sp.]|nr:tetratricopeptide repeat protein [Treponema sp.]